jgi:hypothetical protein
VTDLVDSRVYCWLSDPACATTESVTLMKLCTTSRAAPIAAI